MVADENTTAPKQQTQASQAASTGVKALPGVVYTPVAGKVIPSEEIPDETFAAGILGRGGGMEKESYRNIEVIWLIKGLHPDHKTITRFRQNNPKALKKVFQDFVRLCMKLELMGKDM